MFSHKGVKTVVQGLEMCLIIYELHMSKDIDPKHDKALENHVRNEESSRWRCSDIMALLLDIGYKEPHRKDVPPASSDGNKLGLFFFLN